MLFDGVLRWWERLRSRRRAVRTPPLAVTDPGLVVVVEAFDPAEADSAVLARSERWDPDRQAVLRHHLRLPAASVARATDLLAEEGWLLREPGGPSPDGSRSDAGSVAPGSPAGDSPTDEAPTDEAPTDGAPADGSPTRDSPAGDPSNAPTGDRPAEDAPARDTAQEGFETGATPGTLARVDAAGTGPRPAAGAAASPSADGMIRLEAVRVQSLDALHCAQARSRMAGLAQRLGGDALGWDALQA